MAIRIEKDSLGQVNVPDDRLFGPQTARAIANFGNPPEGYALSSRPSLVRALVRIKKAAAVANQKLGYLDQRRTRLIIRASDEVAGSTDYSLDFPVHILHGGGGTSGNMNANEVIANLANRLVGAPLGVYSPVHPLDHVNRNQSTNDVYPSACRLSLASETTLLLDVLAKCIDRFRTLQARFGAVPRVTRTCLQDAVASDWGRYFDAQAQVLTRHHRRLSAAMKSICTINLGGGVAGEPGSAPPHFQRIVIEMLAEEFSPLPIRGTRHFSDAAQNSDDLVCYSQAVDGLCRSLIKQASDLRLLSSGPECGLMEVILPARQPGSSAMPGKVNPVIPEFVMQCCFTTLGFVSSCGLAAQHAELDLNVWEGVFSHSMCASLGLLVPALKSFEEFCLDGLRINETTSIRNSKNNTSELTAYARKFSYSKALARIETAQSKPGSKGSA